MDFRDHKDAFVDAVGLRLGTLTPALAHPFAAGLADGNLLKAYAEYIGGHSARPGTAPQAFFAAGLSSDDFRLPLSGALRSATVGRLTAHAGHRKWCDMRRVRDFKDHEFPGADFDADFKEKNEGGEFNNEISVAVNDGLTARVKAFGVNVHISREAIRNDDIQLVGGLFSNLGASAARIEGRLAYALLESNPTLGDSMATFHVDHGNIEANALSETALGSAMGRLRTMETPAGAKADLAAAHLLVSPELELLALRLLHDAGIETIRVHAAPWLPTGRWYLLADPSQAPVIALLHLKGGDAGVTVGPIRGNDMRDGLTLGVRFDVEAVAVGRVGAVRGGA